MSIGISNSVDANHAPVRAAEFSEKFRECFELARCGVAGRQVAAPATPHRVEGQETVQAVPFRVKAAGLVALPVWVPLKPKLVDAPGASVPL